MELVNEAMGALKLSALKAKKVKGLAESVDSLTTTLRLLDLSLGTDSQIFQKLVAAVREPFIPLYGKFPSQAFGLSAAIFSFLFHEKIVIQLSAGNRVLQSSWEGVAESLLSGVLDFLETRSDGATLRRLASALYPVLCRICFSTTFCSSITTGSTLRYTAFAVLVDSASEPANKEVLRDPEYLGSRRLGATLYGSKDYVVLENLLLLVLIVAPKFEVMAERSAFVRGVFVAGDSEDTRCGEDLARILTKPTKSDSDLLQAQAIDVLAKSNLMFPQPFDVAQIDSCGLRFPQKPPQQRLIVDYKSLLANVIKDEGYESFRVSFDQICDIGFYAVGKKSLTKVVVQLSSAPMIQSRPLKTPEGQSPSVTFEIRESDASRFKHALRSRGIKAGPPHISVTQGSHRLEFDQEGDPVPEALPPVNKAQAVERDMQLSQQSDDSSEDKDDQGCERPVVIDERLDPTAAAFIGSVTTQVEKKSTTTLSSARSTNNTPHPKPSRQTVVLVPTTPSQNKVLRKDPFGLDNTDLSEPSDDSEVDSMKALSQKVAARADSMIATKRASILAGVVPSVGVSGKKVTKRRILDSDDEEALSGPRNGAKGNSKPSAINTTRALSTTAVSDVEEDISPPPVPLKKGRLKPTKKNPGPLGEKPKPLTEDKESPKRKREDVDDDDGGATRASDVRDKPPPVKRARKTAGGRPGTTKAKIISPVPSPVPRRDSQVLKKVRPGAKKNVTYGGRARAARTSSPTRNPPALSDDFSDVLQLETRLVDPSVEPSLVDDGDDYCASPPPTPPKPKPKLKAAVKPKPVLREESHPLEKSKTVAAKTKAKTPTGTRTRATAAKSKDADEVKAVKNGPPQKAKTKAKRKPGVVLKRGGADKEKEEKGEDELVKDSPAAIEFFSTPPEPPKMITPKRKQIPRVTLEEERVVNDQPKTKKPTTPRPALKKVAPSSLGEKDSRVKEVVVEPGEIIVPPAPSPMRSTPTEKGTKMPTKPISERAFAMSLEGGQGDHAPKSFGVERLHVAELRASGDSFLAEARPPITVSGDVNHQTEAEVVAEKEAVVASALGSHDMDVEPGRSDPVVTKSTVEVQTGGIIKVSPVRIREAADPEEPRPLEMNSEDGAFYEGGGIRGFTPPQPIMDRMLVSVSTPKERLEISAGTRVTMQSTPTTLPRGQRVGQVASGNPRVTFATGPFEDKEATRTVQNEAAHRGGTQRRTIFGDDTFGMDSARKRTPEKSSEKHTTLIELLGEIQDVIVGKIAHRFEAAEEEARFARNDVHNEALTDFKKMHTQRAVQFNALVDLETGYATRERELVAAYEATRAANAEIASHVRQKIREHDERSLVSRLPKTLRKNPGSALVNSYLK